MYNMHVCKWTMCDCITLLKKNMQNSEVCMDMFIVSACVLTTPLRHEAFYVTEHYIRKQRNAN